MAIYKAVPYRYLLLSILWVFTLVSAADSVRYAVTDVSWEPYWIMDGSKASGILHEITLELDKRLSVKLLPSKLLSVKRSKKAFDEGLVQIECCVNIAWRKGTTSSFCLERYGISSGRNFSFSAGKSF